MGKPRSTGPRRRPITQADLEVARQQGETLAYRKIIIFGIGAAIEAALRGMKSPCSAGCLGNLLGPRFHRHDCPNKDAIETPAPVGPLHGATKS